MHLETEGSSELRDALGDDHCGNLEAVIVRGSPLTEVIVFECVGKFYPFRMDT